MAKAKEKATVEAISKGTKIQFCPCEHEFQDKEYGKNKRLHNKGLKGLSCTVCGNIKKE